MASCTADTLGKASATELHDSLHSAGMWKARVVATGVRWGERTNLLPQQNDNDNVYLRNQVKAH